MKNKILVLAAACALTLGFARPSYADGVLGDIGSAIGATTGLLISAPITAVHDAVLVQPWKMSKELAGHFGDENGFEQNIVGHIIGVPWGVVWGVPTGYIRGAKNGWETGWDKPFSTESMWVAEDK